MKNPFKKRSTSADIEAELAKLSAKMTDLQRQRSEKLQALEEAKAARREALAEDDAVIEAATAKVRKLTADVDDMAAMIDEYSAAIEAAQERFRTAHDSEVRQAAAARLEGIAARVDTITPELQKSVAQLASAVRKLISGLPPEIGVFPAHHSHRPDGRPEGSNAMMSPREVIIGLVAEVLFAEFPDFFDHGTGLMLFDDPAAPQPAIMGFARRRTPGLPAPAAIDALLTSRLRDRAARILAGEADPVLTDIKIAEPYRAPPPDPEMQIVGLRDFRFLYGQPGFKPLYRCIAKGSSDLINEKAARYAISRGVAAPADSAEARQVLEAQRNQKSVRVGFGPAMEDHLDIGDPLGLQAAYDKVKADIAANDEIAAEAARAVG